MNYQEASALLQRGRGGKEWERRKLANNTYLERVPGGAAIGVRLHSTYVVTLAPDGSVTLNSGGWLTLTTKDRINSYLPYGWGLYQDEKVWYLYPPAARSSGVAGDYWGSRKERRLVFADGMTIFPDGRVTGAGEAPDPKLLRQINNFARAYADNFIAGKVPKPSGGDCWGCLFEKDLRNGQNLGTDHLLSHMGKGERYYVPSMLNNAHREFPGHFPPVVKWVVAAYWQEGMTPEEVKAKHGHYVEFARLQIRKTIRWYLLRAFGFAR